MELLPHERRPVQSLRRVPLLEDLLLDARVGEVRRRRRHGLHAERDVVHHLVHHVLELDVAHLLLEASALLDELITLSLRTDAVEAEIREVRLEAPPTYSRGQLPRVAERPGRDRMEREYAGALFPRQKLEFQIDLRASAVQQKLYSNTIEVDRIGNAAMY